MIASFFSDCIINMFLYKTIIATSSSFISSKTHHEKNTLYPDAFTDLHTFRMYTKPTINRPACQQYYSITKPRQSIIYRWNNRIINIHPLTGQCIKQSCNRDTITPHEADIQLCKIPGILYQVAGNLSVRRDTSASTLHWATNYSTQQQYQ